VLQINDIDATISSVGESKAARGVALFTYPWRSQLFPASERKDFEVPFTITVFKVSHMTYCN